MTPPLVISELFRSIQGETTYVGLPCVFVRTAGCNLRCAWCDTAYAQVMEGREATVEDLSREVLRLSTGLVCITGGEPLLQPEPVAALAQRLLAQGQTVLVETNGTLDVGLLPEGAVRIMDVKCPSSGESGKTLAANLAKLQPRDEVKFVVADEADFEWAVGFIRAHGLTDGPQLLFSPVFGRLEPDRLASWVVASRLPLRLQLQLHKILWPDRDRGV